MFSPFFHLYYRVWRRTWHTVGIWENSAVNGQVWEPLGFGLDQRCLHWVECEGWWWFCGLGHSHTFLQKPTSSPTRHICCKWACTQVPAHSQLCLRVHPSTLKCWHSPLLHQKLALPATPPSPIHAHSQARCTQTHTPAQTHEPLQDSTYTHACCAQTHTCMRSRYLWNWDWESGSTPHPGLCGSHNASHTKKKIHSILWRLQFDFNVLKALKYWLFSDFARG